MHGTPAQNSPFSGYGGLSLSIEGPSKVDINTEDLEDGTCRVTYCPTEPGNYIINIKFADQHVPGEWDTWLSPLRLQPWAHLQRVTSGWAYASFPQEAHSL